MILKSVTSLVRFYFFLFLLLQLLYPFRKDGSLIYHTSIASTRKITAYNFQRTMLSKEQLFSKSQRMLSWNPILTKDSCGSKGSSYKRTRNDSTPPPPLSARLFGLHAH
jgi:hypothetical protein